MYLLDTDIATLLYYGQNDSVRKQFESIPESEIIALPIITMVQIMNGRFRSLLNASNYREIVEASRRLVETENWLSGFDVIPISEGAARIFDELRAGKRNKIGIPDTILAAIAIDKRAALVTRNLKDFSQIHGLRLENWAD